MSDALVKMENISKIYLLGEVEVKALTDIDLEVEKGEFIVILGPSGSGKTTLLNLIGGIDKPTFGNLYVDNQNLLELNENKITNYRRQKIGFIFQFFNLIPTLTAVENVALISDLTNNKRSDPMDILKQVGLKDREYHFPNQLSGGEQQRVALARALAKKAPIMLCDEPTGELDFETGKKILALFRHLNKEEGQTFIIVTHNTAVGEIADRVIKLRSGKIVEEVKNKRILDPEKLRW